MAFEFVDRVAVVTGAAGGIGRALAMAAAKAGSDIVLTDLDAAGLTPLVKEVESLGRRALALPCDLTRDADVERLAHSSIEWQGHIDLLFNNAGVGAVGLPEQIPLDDWRWLFDVNVFGLVRCIRSFLPHLIERGSGHIVNTCSLAGLLVLTTITMPYTSSKFAVMAISQILRVYLEPKGIGVTCLCPGAVETAFAEHRRVTDSESGLVTSPRLLRRHLPEEVARVTIQAVRDGRFLALTDPEYIDVIVDRARDLDQALATRTGLL